MIVIGAIALVVLVVVITIFISGARSTRPKEEKSCAEANGFSGAVPAGTHFVISPTQCVAIGGSPIIGKFSDVTAPMVCCNKGACDNLKVKEWMYKTSFYTTQELAENAALNSGDTEDDVFEIFHCKTGSVPRDTNKYQENCCT